MRTDKEIDRLYGLPLDEFVSARDQLAQELRKGGDRDAAAKMKALAKPNVSAWALNQLARRERERMRRLLSAGSQLRKAFAAGKGWAMRDATERQQVTIDELVAAARAILEESGHTASDATLKRIADTLQAGSVQEDAGESLLRGRLARELAPTGFAAFQGLPVATPGKRSRPAGTAARPVSKARGDDAARKRGIGEAEAALAAARTKVRELERKLAAAEREAAKAHERAETAEREARNWEERLKGAKASLEQAAERLASLSE